MIEIYPFREISEVNKLELTKLEEVLEKARKQPAVKLAVAAAEDEVILEAVKIAEQDGLVEPVLIGDENKIKQKLQAVNYGFKGEVIHAIDNKAAAEQTMELIAAGQADLPMKGQLSSKTILKALLKEDYGFRQGKLLNLVTMVQLEKENRLVFITDAGVNIAPVLEEKAEIIKNTAAVARAIGFKSPMVAPLAAVEKVNPAMPATLEAAALSKMAERGQLGDVIVDGPLAFDNAISPEAAKFKGINSPVAGKADILLVPDIEAGNILYKTLVLYLGLLSASTVVGASVPLVLTSRSDSIITKYNSIAFAKLALLYYKVRS